MIDLEIYRSFSATDPQFRTAIKEYALNEASKFIIAGDLDA